MRTGSEEVHGLHGHKQAILEAGGNVLDLAVAMLETRRMKANYPYGDGKTGDAANFGIFKQNWLMIRSSVSQYAGLGADDYRTGSVLNHDLRWDIHVLHASQGHYGLDRLWFAGHRGGQSGLDGRWSQDDINNYRQAIFWIRDQIEADATYRTDNTRFWVDVPPV
jgi:hypothetical protein